MYTLIFKILTLALLLGAFEASPALGSPYELSYSGRLAEESGKPLNGPVNFLIKFFRSQQNDDDVGVTVAPYYDVPLVDGVFQIKIALTPAEFHTVFNTSDDVWIQLTELGQNKVYPRQKFSAVPYALKVPVDGQSITYNSNGQLALGNGNNTLTLPATAGAQNKVLKSDGSGGLIWADDLSGGGPGSITTGEIQDNTLTDADIATNAAIDTSKLSGALTDVNGHGLGDAAGLNVGTTAGTVAAGNHSHAAATTMSAGFMSATDKAKLDGIAASADVDTNAQTICGDGEYLRGDAANTCKTAGDIVGDGRLSKRDR